MPVRTQLETYKRGDGQKAATFVEELVWTHSPRNASGKLMLQANRMRHLKSRLMTNTASDPSGLVGSADNIATIRGYTWFSNAETLARQRAYGKFRGKLMEGSAALGVTLASLRQSREIIEKRANLVASSADALSALAERNMRRAVTKKMADSYLETVFGWVPLISDIHASCMTVIQKATPTEYVKASAMVQTRFEDDQSRPGWHTSKVTYDGTVSCKFATGVRVTNPNLWLLNRAGLLNPAAVAWDLVPWSFVINMVTNVGSLVNSISDFYGLTFENASTTVKWHGGRTASRDNIYPGTYSFSFSDLSEGKWRDLGVPAYPRVLQFRTPEFSWATAGIAASLLIQKANLVGNLLGKIIPDRKP